MPSTPTAAVLLALVLLGSTGCWVITPGDVADHDAALDADTGTDPYNPDFGDRESWEVFDLAEVGADWNTFQGTTFDGRYLYFTKYGGTAAYRYDTQASFTAMASWESVDLEDVDGSTEGLGAAVFDGTYVYYGPNDLSGSGIFFRYDPATDFTSPTSWASFDIGHTVVHNGASFDGRYLYFYCIEYIDQIRYDTQGPFTDPGSWEEFDASDFVAGGGVGSIFDGRHVYYPPWQSGQISRYDTQGPFTSAGSWESFDVQEQVSALADCCFVSGTFDGSNVYFSATWGKPLLRYDPAGGFTDPSSWADYDVADIGYTTYFNGAVFDGRYVTYVPGGEEDVVRYDTRLAFDSPEAWEGFNQRSLDANAHSFGNGAFDGRYVYLVANGRSVIARFDARNPAAMPESFAGSFF